MLTLPGYISKHSIALYFRISIWIFCTQFICLVLDGLLQSLCFRMLCSKHSITLENKYLIRCWFHCVVKLCIKFRFCDTFTVTNFVTRIFLIETLSNFRTIKSCFTLYLRIYHLCFVVVIAWCRVQYGKYFGVSHILQLISQAFRRVK